MKLNSEEHSEQIATNSARAPLPSEAVDGLQRVVSLAIREAVANHQAEVRGTLRLCLAAFDAASGLNEVPQPFRVLARVCRALCLDGLGEMEDEEYGEELSDMTSHTRTI